ncbi:MAG: protein kinase [Planctomycetota bacterium]|nr:protein kinase [Planctomycetota bacterium]
MTVSSDEKLGYLGETWFLESGERLSTKELYRAWIRETVQPDIRCRSVSNPDLKAIQHRFQLIGPYGILGRLGEGNFGTVYLAFNAKRESGNRLVALKQPSESLLERYAEIAGIKDDPNLPTVENRKNALRWARVSIGQAFAQEAVLTARLSMCPNVVSILDQDVSLPYMVLEYCDGGTLMSRMRRPYDLGCVLRWGHELTLGLTAAHELEPNQLVHRDLKPDNILLDKGQLKISDFGTAQMVDKMDSLRSLRGGFTPVYAAPEAFEGRAYPGTDIWSLGVILYELCKGARPFSGAAARLMNAILSVDPKPLSGDWVVDPPPELIEFINRCLHKDHEDRPKAGECAQIMETLRSRYEANHPNPSTSPKKSLTADQQSAPTPFLNPKRPSARHAEIEEVLSPENSATFSVRAQENGKNRRWISISIALSVVLLLGLSWNLAGTRKLMLHVFALGGRPGARAIAARLSDPAPSVRRKALELLKDNGSAAILIPYLSHEDELIRREIRRILLERREEVIPELVEALENAEEENRRAIVLLLADMGPNALNSLIEFLANDSLKAEISFVLVKLDKVAVPRLVQALDKPRIKAEAEQVLIRIGASSVEPVINLLPKKQNAKQARRILGQIGLAAVPKLISALGEPNLKPHAKAILGTAPVESYSLLIVQLKDRKLKLDLRDLLISFGPKAIPALSNALKTQKLITKEITQILATIGPKASKILLKALCDKSGRLSHHAAAAILSLGSHAFDDLIERSLDPIALNRSRVLTVLGNLGSKLDARQRPRLLRTLIRGLSDLEEQPRKSAKNALVVLGPQAVPAVLRTIPKSESYQQLCLEILNEGGSKVIEIVIKSLFDPELMKSAELSLQSMGSKAVTPILYELSSVEKKKQAVLAAVLAKLGKSAIKPLMAQLVEGQTAMKKAAAIGFVALGKSGAGALVAQAATSSTALQEWIKSILVQIGTEAYDALKEGIQSRNPKLRLLCIDCVGTIAVDKDDILSILIKKLGSEDVETRREAATALGNFGKAAASALKALEQRQRDSNPMVRQSVSRAISKIKGQ